MEVVALSPVVSLIAGILILIMPKLLNYIVAIYLILIGVLVLVGARRWKIPPYRDAVAALERSESKS